MSGGSSTCYSTDTTLSDTPACLKQTRHVLPLLAEAERSIHRNPDAAATYLHQAIAALAAEDPREPLQRKARGGRARSQVTRTDDLIQQHIDPRTRTTD